MEPVLRRAGQHWGGGQARRGSESCPGVGGRSPPEEGGAWCGAVWLDKCMGALWLRCTFEEDSAGRRDEGCSVSDSDVRTGAPGGEREEEEGFLGLGVR